MIHTPGLPVIEIEQIGTYKRVGIESKNVCHVRKNYKRVTHLFIFGQ